MKLYAVLAYDRYYPLPNNIKRVFRTEEEAESYVKIFTKLSNEEYDKTGLGNYDCIGVEVINVED